jgi:ribosome-binding factor A
MTRRTDRINSLLKQVISDVIRDQVKNPHLPRFVTITHVETTSDLHHAKVYVSVIGDDRAKKEAILTLQSAAGFIGVHASKEVTMRYFPELMFVIDDTVDKQMRIDSVIQDIEKERKSRE